MLFEGNCTSDIDAIEPKPNVIVDKERDQTTKMNDTDQTEKTRKPLSRIRSMTLRKEPFSKYYEMSGQLGVGFTSKVYTCTNIETKSTFACKVF